MKQNFSQKLLAFILSIAMLISNSAPVLAGIAPPPNMQTTIGESIIESESECICPPETQGELVHGEACPLYVIPQQAPAEETPAPAEETPAPAEQVCVCTALCAEGAANTQCTACAEDFSKCGFAAPAPTASEAAMAIIAALPTTDELAAMDTKAPDFADYLAQLRLNTAAAREAYNALTEEEKTAFDADALAKLMALEKTLAPITPATLAVPRATPAADVAMIGNTGYATLALAVENAQPGATIRMIAEDATDQKITINQNLSIELDGHSLTKTRFKISGGTVSISDSKGQGVINSDKRLGINADVAENDRCYASIYVTGNANVTLNNLQVKCYPDSDGRNELIKAIFVGGSGSLTINGGSYTGEKQPGYDAVFFFNNFGANLTINDGHFEANCGLSVNKAPGDNTGKLLIKKATFVGSRDAFYVEGGSLGAIDTEAKAKLFLTEGVSHIVGAFNQARIVVGSELFVSGGFTAPENGSANPETPAAITPTEGDAVTLEPQILGGDGSKLTYEWAKDKTPISGATDPTYTIPKYTESDDGNYTVKITENEGTTLNIYWTVGTAGGSVAPPNSDTITIEITYDSTTPITKSNIGGTSLSDAVTKALEDPYGVTSVQALKITAGEMTAADWNYFAGGAPGTSDSLFKFMKSFEIEPNVTVDNIPNGKTNKSIFPSTIEKVIIPQKITVGNYAFEDCRKLSTATMPGATAIGQYAFDNCELLTAMNLNNVTSIGTSAFSDCVLLASVSLPKVTAIGVVAFGGCVKLADLKLPKNPPAVGTSAFSACSALNQLILAGEDGTPLSGTEKTDAEKLYDDITTEDGNKANDGLWYGLKVREPITESKITIQVNGATTEYGGTDLNEAVDKAIKSITDSTYADIKKLTITLGEVTKADWLWLSGERTSPLEALTDFTVESAVTSVADILDRYETFPKTIVSVSIPQAISIGNKAFNECTALTTANFPKATSIGDEAFYGCKALTTASFPNATSIGERAFNTCAALTTASFANATSIGAHAFNKCVALTSADFPKATSIGIYAFSECAALTTASFPNATSIGNSAFQYCKVLKTITAPQVTTIGEYAFSNCSLLTTVDFPNATSIGDGAFNRCAALTAASFPKATSIGAYAFSACTSLTTLKLGETVPTVTHINAFQGCNALKRIVFVNANGEELTEETTPTNSEIAAKYDKVVSPDTGTDTDGLWYGINVGTTSVDSKNQILYFKGDGKLYYHTLPDENNSDGTFVEIPAGTGGDWVAEGNVLKLYDFNFTTTAKYGLIISGEATVMLYGDNSITSTYTSSTESDESAGIYCSDSTTFVQFKNFGPADDPGTLTVTGGNLTGKYSSSHGILTDNFNFTISECIVNAIGGAAPNSYGLKAAANVAIKNGAKVSGQAANATAVSYGVDANTSLNIGGGCELTGKAGTATNSFAIRWVGSVLKNTWRYWGGNSYNEPAKAVKADSWGPYYIVKDNAPTNALSNAKITAVEATWVSADGKTSGEDTLLGALDKVKSIGGTVTMITFVGEKNEEDEIGVNISAEFTAPVTLKLNGNTLCGMVYAAGNPALFTIDGTATSSRIECTQDSAIVTDGRNLKIKGGKYFGYRSSYRHAIMMLVETNEAAEKEKLKTLLADGYEFDNDGVFRVIEEGEDFFAVTGESVYIQKAVPVAVKGVTLNKTALSLEEGKSEALTATFTPANATNKAVTWKSGNSGVATVDKNGMVTAISVGNATITVTTTDGNKTATCTVTVTPKTINPAPGGKLEGTLDQDKVDKVFGEGNATLDTSPTPPKITINNNIITEEPIEIETDVTIDLGGNTITGKPGESPIIVGDNNKVIIGGNGSVTGGNNPSGAGGTGITGGTGSEITIDKGTTVEGGNGTSGGNGIQSGGNVTVNGNVSGGNGSSGNGGNGVDTSGSTGNITIGGSATGGNGGNGTATGGSGGNGTTSGGTTTVGGDKDNTGTTTGGSGGSATTGQGGNGGNGSSGTGAITVKPGGTTTGGQGGNATTGTGGQGGTGANSDNGDVTLNGGTTTGGSGGNATTGTGGNGGQGTNAGGNVTVSGGGSAGGGQGGSGTTTGGSGGNGTTSGGTTTVGGDNNSQGTTTGGSGGSATTGQGGSGGNGSTGTGSGTITVKPGSSTDGGNGGNATTGTGGQGGTGANSTGNGNVSVGGNTSGGQGGNGATGGQGGNGATTGGDTTVNNGGTSTGGTGGTGTTVGGNGGNGANAGGNVTVSGGSSGGGQGGSATTTGGSGGNGTNAGGTTTVGGENNSQGTTTGGSGGNATTGQGGSGGNGSTGTGAITVKPGSNTDGGNGGNATTGTGGQGGTGANSTGNGNVSVGGNTSGGQGGNGATGGQGGNGTTTGGNTTVNNGGTSTGGTGGTGTTVGGNGGNGASSESTTVNGGATGGSGGAGTSGSNGNGGNGGSGVNQESGTVNGSGTVTGGNGGVGAGNGNGGSGGNAIGGSASAGGSLATKDGVTAKVEVVGDAKTEVKLPDPEKTVDAVMTPQEKADDDITSVKVTLKVDDKTDNKPLDAQKAEDAKPEKGIIGAFFDITLQKTITKNGTEQAPESVTAVPSGTVSITIEIPSNMKGGSNYVVIRVHNNAAEKLTTTQSGNELTFETDKFSTYALSYTPASVVKPDTPEQGGTNSQAPASSSENKTPAKTPAQNKPIQSNEGGSLDAAIKVLDTLQKADVAPNWAPDVEANRDRIEKMLDTVKAFTDSDKENITQKQKDLMLEYFTTLYELDGKDTAELATLFEIAKEEPAPQPPKEEPKPEPEPEPEPEQTPEPALPSEPTAKPAEPADKKLWPWVLGVISTGFILLLILLLRKRKKEQDNS